MPPIGGSKPPVSGAPTVMSFLKKKATIIEKHERAQYERQYMEREQ